MIVQRVFLLGAAARVLVQHRHQFAQRGFAVAVHADRFALGGGHHLAAHHQQAVLHAVDEFLDDDLRALGFGQREGGLDFSLARELQRHAARVVAVRGLDGDGATDVLGHFPGFLGIGHHAALGHRHAAGSEQALGEVLVLRNPFGDGAGLVAFCRPDAALRCAVAQLHQIAIVQADKGNAPLRRRIDDAGRAWPQVTRLDGLLNGGHGGGHIKRLVIDRRHDEGVALLQRHFGHQLFGAAKHHAVHPALAHAAGLAKLSAHAGQVEQLDDGVLQHMAAPRAFLQAL